MTPTRTLSRRTAVKPALAILALLSAPVAALAAPAPSLRFDIPAGSLEAALLTYANQSRQQLLFDRDLVSGRLSPALAGTMTADEALERLLAGSPVTVVRSRPGVVVLKRTAAGASPQAEADPPGAVAPVVDELVVTGSLIRGAADSASPVTTLSRNALDRAGQATVAEALAALPQNFGGTSTPQTALLGSDGLATNYAVSSGVNLRGLGSTSTLILVNGRRMAGSGLKGDFADLSAIPTAAVDRIEVLLDGASALYGSDAVGGVVNVILRTDFDGAETRLRYGGATRGGDGDTLVGQTFGKTWSSGRVLISYEYQDKTRLAARERDFTETADLRPLGGTDHRLVYSHPGNLLALDPVTFSYVPAFAIAPGADGPSFIAGQSNLENYRALSNILPQQDRNSLYLNAAQNLTPRLALNLEARYSRRGFSYDLPENLSVFQVDAANPFYATPNGDPSEVVGYAFGDELGPVRNTGVTQNYAVSAGATLDLGRTWRIDAYGDYAAEDGRVSTTNLVNSGFLNEALGAVGDDPATAFAAARDGYFNPFGATGANRAEVLDFIGSGYASIRTLSRIAEINIKADGTIAALPGGDVKVALGAQARRELFKTSSISLLDGPAPDVRPGQTFGRTLGAVFAELRVPLVGPANSLPGVRRLELSLAGRIEHYEDVGLTGNPKLGLIWAPAQDVKLRASYGTSFRAPALTEVYALQAVGPAFIGPDQTLSLIRYGGDRDLKPETATSWTVGGDYAPSWVPGLTLAATWFDIDYQNRIGTPVLESIDSALSDPSYAAFVTRLDPSANPADLARVQALLATSTSSSAGLFPPSAYGAIIDARYVNTSSLIVRGIDLAVAYRRAFGPHSLDLAFDGSYLVDYRRRLTPSGDAVDLSGRAEQPSDLRFRSSATWTHGAYGATFGLNFVDGATTSTGASVDAWTTMDLQLLWRSPAKAGPLKGVSLALNASNLLDADPPFYDSPAAVGYDPANADALGRVLSLQLSRRW